MMNLQALIGILNHPLNKNHRIKTLLRLVWWKINQLFFKMPTIVSISTGVKCICYPESSFGSQIIYTKFPEYSEINFVSYVLKPRDTFVDIGAGLGDYSLVASSKIKEGKIFSFEPHPVAFNYLKENVALNKLEGKIFPVQNVVSDKNGFEKFTPDKISELSHISTEKDSSEGQVRLPSITLDSYSVKHKAGKIKIVKIDVEGAEYKVLAGAKNLLRNAAIDFLIIEINKRNALYHGSAEKTFTFLRKHNYSIYVFDDYWKLTPLKKYTARRRVYNILAVSKKKSYTIKTVDEYISS